MCKDFVQFRVLQRAGLEERKGARGPRSELASRIAGSESDLE